MTSLVTTTRRTAVEHASDMKKQLLFVEMKMAVFGLGTWLM
jgi:hypothetical protein